MMLSCRASARGTKKNKCHEATPVRALQVAPSFLAHPCRVDLHYVQPKLDTEDDGGCVMELSEHDRMARLKMPNPVASRKIAIG